MKFLFWIVLEWKVRIIEKGIFTRCSHSLIRIVDDNSLITLSSLSSLKLLSLFMSTLMYLTPPGLRFERDISYRRVERVDFTYFFNYYYYEYRYSFFKFCFGYERLLYGNKNNGWWVKCIRSSRFVSTFLFRHTPTYTKDRNNISSYLVTEGGLVNVTHRYFTSTCL